MFDNLKEAIQVFLNNPLVAVIVVLAAIECGLILVNEYSLITPPPPASIVTRTRVVSEYRVIRPDNGRWQAVVMMGVFAITPDGQFVAVR